MADQANDFIRDYQALAQQSWDAWTRQLQQQQSPQVANPFFTPPAAPASGNATIERTLAGLKSYFDWMQGAAAGGAAAPSADWRQQVQQLFGGATQPFTQAFGGIDSASAEGFARQWQTWLQAAQSGGFADLPGTHGPTPAFGLNRERQMQHEAMTTAVLASLQASARYQELIQRANSQGTARLQDKLAQHAEPGRQIDSLKALYDLWVDAAEEAYAEVALSDEFRAAYGEMVNTQMRVRQLQQQQTEQVCQQMGVPTRSEVSSLGERLQALRREVRAAAAPADHAGEIAALRRELAALKQQVSAGRATSATARKGASTGSAARPGTSAVKKSIAKVPVAPSRKSGARKSSPAAGSRAKAVTRVTTRKRK